MALQQELDKVFSKYSDWLDMTIGSAFVREPFVKDFRKLVGLKTSAAFVKAFDDFMVIAHRTFHWDNYLEARTTAEKAFREFYEGKAFAEADKDKAVHDFLISFFNACVDEHEFTWMDNHPNEEYSQPQDTEDDIDNLYLARVFTCAADFGNEAENIAFCDSIGVQYNHEQLHMCCWFAAQITNGAGHYSRSEVNYSARTTYNRLLEPRSLLWIGVALGADKAALKAAAEEMKTAKSNQTKCGIVRKHVPFETIRALYQKLMYEEDKE